MNREGHFGELTAYLPWRYESTWRDRAGNVFADWVVSYLVFVCQNFTVFHTMEVEE